jgi:hypothetical protein
MLSESKPDDVRRSGADPSAWAEDFAGLMVVSMARLGRSLDGPFDAALAAWTYEHELDSEWINELRDSFPAWLAAMCGQKPGTLAGDRQKAFDVFMACLVVLLTHWRTEPPLGVRYGSVAAHWCAGHPAIYSKVQAAIRARSSVIRIALADWTLADVLKHGRGEPPKAEKLELKTVLQFSGQRTWAQAAATAAYALFGDFLMDESETTEFCKRCAKPFRIGKKKLFCSLRCARIHSAIQSRHEKVRISRRRKFRNAAGALARLLESGLGARTDWRDHVQRKAGMQTRDARRSRGLTAFIRASQAAPGSPEREGLLRSLQVDSDGNPDTEEREALQREFDSFLSNIQKAEEIQQRGKRK